MKWWLLKCFFYQLYDLLHSYLWWSDYCPIPVNFFSWNNRDLSCTFNALPLIVQKFICFLRKIWSSFLLELFAYFLSCTWEWKSVLVFLLQLFLLKANLTWQNLRVHLSLQFSGGVLLQWDLSQFLLPSSCVQSTSWWSALDFVSSVLFLLLFGVIRTLWSSR